MKNLSELFVFRVADGRLWTSISIPTQTFQLFLGVIVLIFISVGSKYMAVIKQADRDKYDKNLTGRPNVLFRV